MKIELEIPEEVLRIIPVEGIKRYAVGAMMAALFERDGTEAAPRAFSLANDIPAEEYERNAAYARRVRRLLK